ncbi:MAG TPA: TonB-dependent receptor [Longimicrobiales bacterium]|nr:TonB-dependent receptor [Longimicrobiales bacterium]
MKRLIAGAVLAQAAWSVPAAAQAPPDTARVRIDAIIVESTRAGRLPEDEPLRVEVVGREEIEEKLLMTPGDIAMLLNEMGGVRVQQTAPAFGGAAVRIQGMRGQYAQILVDGLPLHGEATGLGPLQIPPMDLRQVELIKGPASALYGASALGGVVNLISRRPDGERELLVNATTRGGLDAVAWLASDEAAAVGWTLVAGGHDQPSVDVSGDGWSDMPAHRRATIRPRLFASSGASTVMLTAGAVVEQRTGGFQDASTGIDALDTRRADAGLVAATWWGARRVTFRGALVEQRNDRVFAGRPERDGHSSLFGEAAVAGVLGGQTWVAGTALQRESYRHRDVDGVDEATVTPGLFLQQEWSPAEWLAMSASGRVDVPTDHGALFSPRLAVLLRPGDWTVRVSAGAGHHLPGYWIEEVEAIGLGHVARDPLAVERATSYSVDVGREIGDVAVNVTGFTSRITDAVALRGAGTAHARVANVPGITRTRGAELLLNADIEPIHAIASWTWLSATEPDPDGAGRRDVALTPGMAAGLVLMWEMEDEAGRVGFETYFTGEQPLHDNPYRERSRPYVLFGVLAERRVGPARVFVNFENIGGVRQTRWDPLLLPQRAADGRRTTEAWAPLDGRVINGGVRLDF